MDLVGIYLSQKRVDLIIKLYNKTRLSLGEILLFFNYQTLIKTDLKPNGFSIRFLNGLLIIRDDQIYWKNLHHMPMPYPQHTKSIVLHPVTARHACGIKGLRPSPPVIIVGD